MMRIRSMFVFIRTVFAQFVALISLPIVCGNSYAGTWLVTPHQTGDSTLQQRGVRITNPFAPPIPFLIDNSTSWVDETLNGNGTVYAYPLAITDLNATVGQNNNIWYTLVWQPDNGEPPPPQLHVVVYTNSDLNLSGGQPGQQISFSNMSVNDGTNAPTIFQNLGTNVSMYSQGVHLKTLDTSSGVVTIGPYPTSNFVNVTNVGFSVNIWSHTYVNICLLDQLDPFPDNLANSDPVILYHGADLNTAQFLAQETTDLDERGGVDFGAGFYTLDSTAFDMAQLFAERSRDNKQATWWGVLEIDVPLTTMMDFFCQYQDTILGYKDATGLNDPASWNSPSFPDNVPDPNFTPNLNPANIPIPNGQLNWTNFCWYNYWYDLCDLGNPAPTDIGTDNYIPDWNLISDHYDWQYAMIWGNFYRGPGTDCNDYRRGSLFNGRLGVIYQYVWGTGGGLEMLNQRDASGKLVATRSVIKQPGAP